MSGIKLQFSSSEIQPVGLANVGDVYPVGTCGSIAGFGRLSIYGKLPPKLQRAYLWIVNDIGKCGLR